MCDRFLRDCLLLAGTGRRTEELRIVTATLHSATVVIGGIPVALQTADPAFIPVLEARYAGFMNGAGAAKVQPGNVLLELVGADSQPGGAYGEIAVKREGKVWHMRRWDLRAEWDRSTGRGKVWEAVSPHSIDTVLRILHSLLLAERDGFLLHAASAVVGNRGLAFSGVSGAGKTTLSRLAPPPVTVLTDEISYLKMEEGELHAWGTPFAGEMATPGPNCSAPLAGVFLLTKGPQNKVEPISQDEAVCSILRNVLFFANDSELTAHVLETVCQLVEKVPVRRLIFRPDPSVWDFIASLEE